MAKINLLPWRDQLREERKRDFFIFLTCSVLAAVFVWGMVHFTYGQWLDYQNYRNQYLTREIGKLDKKIAEIRDLKRLKAALIARMGIIQELQANRPRVVHLFDELVKILPAGVHFSQVALRGNIITLEGLAASNTNISQLMRNISMSAWLHKPELKQIKTDEHDGQQVSQFSLQSVLINAKFLKR